MRGTEGEKRKAVTVHIRVRAEIHFESWHLLDLLKLVMEAFKLSQNLRFRNLKGLHAGYVC